MGDPQTVTSQLQEQTKKHDYISPNKTPKTTLKMKRNKTKTRKTRPYSTYSVLKLLQLAALRSEEELPEKDSGVDAWTVSRPPRGRSSGGHLSRRFSLKVSVCLLMFFSCFCLLKVFYIHQIIT